MSWFEVDSYLLNYDTDSKEIKVRIRWREDEKGEQASFLLPAVDAIFLVDMLRHEKPVYFKPDSGAISTVPEPVGEEEPQEDVRL